MSVSVQARFGVFTRAVLPSDLIVVADRRSGSPDGLRDETRAGVHALIYTILFVLVLLFSFFAIVTYSPVLLQWRHPLSTCAGRGRHRAFATRALLLLCLSAPSSAANRNTTVNLLAGDGRYRRRPMLLAPLLRSKKKLRLPPTPLLMLAVLLCPLRQRRQACR